VALCSFWFECFCCQGQEFLSLIQIICFYNPKLILQKFT
jgi:hypothetical protein